MFHPSEWIYDFSFLNFQINVVWMLLKVKSEESTCRLTGFTWTFYLHTLHHLWISIASNVFIAKQRFIIDFAFVCDCVKTKYRGPQTDKLLWLIIWIRANGNSFIDVPGQNFSTLHTKVSNWNNWRM